MMRAWRHQRRGLSSEFFQDTIDGVDTCAVAMVGEALAGMIWIYRREHPSRLFRLEAYEAELNHGYILTEFRGHGLFSAVLTFTCRLLQTQGYRTVYAGVHAGNGPSLRAFHNAAFQDIGSVRHYLVFSTQGSWRPASAQAGRAQRQLSNATRHHCWRCVARLVTQARSTLRLPRRREARAACDGLTDLRGEIRAAHPCGKNVAGVDGRALLFGT